MSTPPPGAFDPHAHATDSRPQVHDDHRRSAGALERIQAIGARSRDRFARFQPTMSSDDRDFAAAARRGELGPQWQRIQQRIDAGGSSLEDVLGGRDVSTDAEQVRNTPLPSIEEVEAAAEQMRRQSAGGDHRSGEAGGSGR